ncbi:iron uptake porin [cf. Phormidesmis sp. LEGE 11477]|uniref:iron uptake porin n=1 Tax=cf. Phormidesmis sp. LEGE 11477 TaxID=1828680 RepID=UPI0018816A91|nr:iron uptake porin [cf. Phormidesmis sp. LEGE 11477]MBE9063006.1 carbohydrate porin [cf. Phormidesmis sp. LEGE 11477]
MESSSLQPQSVVYQRGLCKQRLNSLLTTALALGVFTASSTQAAIVAQSDPQLIRSFPLHPEKKSPKQGGLNSDNIRSDDMLVSPDSWTSVSQASMLETPFLIKSSLQEVQPADSDSTESNFTESDSIEPIEEATEMVQAETTLPLVHELSDVRPGDWAFQALQKLSENYDCFSGYPEGTFRGDQALTRSEFAAALDACLSAATEQILAGNVSDQTLAEMQRLQESFRIEIDSLDAQLTQMESGVAALESTSSRIKLNGILWMDANAATFSGDLRRETGERVALGSRERVVENAEEPNPIFSTYGWLDFSTSFAEDDLLLLQLAFGTGTPVVNNLVSAGLEYSGGANFTNQAGGVVPGELVVRELFYEFPAGDDLRLVIAPRVNVFRYFDYSRFSYYFSEDAPPAFNYLSFNSANSTLFNAFDRGTGAIALWNMTDRLELRAAYLAENNEFLPSDLFNTAISDGLFAGTNSLTAELTYHPSPAASIRLLYNYSNLKPLFGKIGPGGVGEPVYGIVDDGFGGPVDTATAHVATIGADWEITPDFGVFGRYSYGNMRISPLTSGREGGNINVQSYQLGMAFPHLFKRGAMGTVSFLVPQDYLSGQSFLASGAGNGGTQFETEIAYYYPVTDRIALLPSIYVVTEPNNFSDNPSLFVFNLRTQFTF